MFKDYHEMLDKTTKEKKPDAMIIGVPPLLHGARQFVKAWLMHTSVSLLLVRATPMQ